MKTIEKTNDVLEKVNETLTAGNTYGWAVNPTLGATAMHGNIAPGGVAATMYGTPVTVFGTQATQPFYGNAAFQTLPQTNIANQVAYGTVQPGINGAFQTAVPVNAWGQPMVPVANGFTGAFGTPFQTALNTPVQTVWNNGLVPTGVHGVMPTTGTPYTVYGNAIQNPAMQNVYGNTFANGATIPTAVQTVLPTTFNGLTPVQAYGTTVEQMLNAAAVRQQTERAFSSWCPAVNIIENEKNFEIEVAVAGLTKEDCKLGCDNGVLWISGTRRVENDKALYTRKELTHGTFYRSFVLPEYLDTEKIQAKCTNGLLTIVIPNKIGTAKKSESEILIS